MIDRHARAQQIASSLREHAGLSGVETEMRLSQARAEDYWQQLAPELRIGGDPPRLPPAASEDEILSARNQLREDGYFRTPQLLSDAVLERCNRAVDVVVAAGWPPAFGWIYDDLWMCTRLPDVAAILVAALGARYRQLPHIWVNEVPEVEGAAGWSPHFDGPSRARASVWLALTDATLSNGCMYLVPRAALPPVFACEWTERTTIPMLDAVRALHAARALPTPRGSALGWTFDVLHWGGGYLAPGQKRRAISMEFIAATEQPLPHEAPFLSLDDPLPVFADRLQLIARGLKTYEPFEPRAARWRAVASQLA